MNFEEWWANDSKWAQSYESMARRAFEAGGKDVEKDRMLICPLIVIIKNFLDTLK